MKIVDIADEIFRELDQPTDGSIPQIAFWIRVNVGSLNNLLYTEYAIDTTTLEISPDPGIQEKSILKRLYNIHYYNLKLRSTLGAISLDTIVEVASDGSSVKKANRNETSKVYVNIKKQEQEELNREIASYKLGKAAPIQVVGDDTIAAQNFPDTSDIRTGK
jgi:hypothetical protein